MKNETIVVQMFSAFSLSYRGEKLCEEQIRSEKILRLLAYMLLNRKRDMISQELVDTLWEGEEVNNPIGTLKNLVYRLRNILKKKWMDIEFIHTINGAYRWNNDIPLVLDVELFEDYYERALLEMDQVVKIKNFKEAINLYKGALLPKLYSQRWIVTMSVYCHSIYLKATKKLLKLLMWEEDYDEIEKICNKTLQIENLDEDIYIYFITAMVKQKQYKAAKEHYQKAIETLYENLGVEPSTELIEVYKEILKEINKPSSKIEEIITEIEEEASNQHQGAYFCDIGILKEMYHIEKRRIKRHGISACVILITLYSAQEISLQSEYYLKEKSEAMTSMKKTLQQVLRSSDVAAQYSDNQYIVLLLTLEKETYQLVVQRIEEGFLKEHKANNVILQFSSCDIEDIKAV